MSVHKGIDGSTTITLGGTAQFLFSSAIPIHGFSVWNPDAAEDLWISESTTAALNATGSLKIPAGAGYESPPSQAPASAISIIGATTGHKFTARYW